MSLLAEELVEEWLNRQGLFTIRGIKSGVNEIDLLAVSLISGQCRHIEVQHSVRPISYITKRNAKRVESSELARYVKMWIEKKFENQQIVLIMKRLGFSNWSRELVVNNVKHPEELDMLIKQRIIVHKFKDIVDELKAGSKGKFVVPLATGKDLVDIINN